MSNACRSLSGTSAARSTFAGAGFAGADGGVPWYDDGRYDRYDRTVSSASCSVLHRKWPTPDSAQCTRAPPIASSVVFSPVTISTIRSEARHMLALPSTTAATSQKAGMYAPPAADRPNRAHTCGIAPDALTWVWKILPA